MTQAEDPKADAALDALLSQAAHDVEAAPDHWVDRVVADAAAWQPDPAAGQVAAPGFMAQVADFLGGWTGMGGLATACAAGLFFGLTQPELVTPTLGIVDAGQEDLFDLAQDALLPDDMLFFEEG